MKITIGCVTYKRKDLFEGFIKSYLQAISRCPKPMIVELVVVENNFNHKYVNEILLKYSLKSKYAIGDGYAWASRNQIYELSSGQFIAFVDDDCLIDEDYFFQLEKSIKKIGDDKNIVGILGEVIRTTNVKSPIDVAYLKSGMDHYFSFGDNKSLCKRFDKVKWGPTANIIIKRSFFKPFLKFDKLKIGGEDVVWGIEITKPSKHFYWRCDDKIKVYHTAIYSDAKSTHLKLIEKTYLYGRSEAILASIFVKYSDTYKLSLVMRLLMYKFVRLIVPYFILKKSPDILMNTYKSSFLIGNLYQSVLLKTWPKSISLTKLANSGVQ